MSDKTWTGCVHCGQTLPHDGVAGDGVGAVPPHLHEHDRRRKRRTGNPLSAQRHGTCVPGLHECVFAEEREPSGRLVLPPCLVCGLAAMDAIEELRRRSSLRSVGGIAESGTDDELDLD